MTLHITHYLNNIEIQENDYVFYSEYNGTNTKFRYADSLCKLVRHNNELCIQTLVAKNHMKKFANVADKPISLKHVNVENIMLVEDYNDDSDLAPLVYMTKYYSKLMQNFRKTNLAHVKFFKTK